MFTTSYLFSCSFLGSCFFCTLLSSYVTFCLQEQLHPVHHFFFLVFTDQDASYFHVNYPIHFHTVVALTTDFIRQVTDYALCFFFENCHNKTIVVIVMFAKRMDKFHQCKLYIFFGIRYSHISSILVLLLLLPPSYGITCTLVMVWRLFKILSYNFDCFLMYFLKL